MFEDLVLDKYVDATFPLRTSRDYWQLTFVDLKLSSSELVRIKKILFFYINSFSLECS